MTNWRFSIWFGLMLVTRLLWPHESVDDMMGRSIMGMVCLEFLAWQVRKEEARDASGMSTGTAKTAKLVEGRSPASPVPERQTPKA